MNFSCQDGTMETGSHWDWSEDGKPILGVDFHHTISTKCGACKDETYGELCGGAPQEGVREALIELHKTFKIIIYTGYGLVSAEKNGDPYSEVRDYLNLYEIPFDEIAPKSHPFAFMIDDRAVHHQNWVNTLDEIKTRMNMKTPSQFRIKEKAVDIQGEKVKEGS